MSKPEVVVNLNQELLLAIDIGGTKIAMALVTEKGELLADSKFSTPQSGPELGIQLLITKIEEFLDQMQIDSSKLSAIGIGIPAVLESGTDFVIWGPNLKGWRNVDLRGELKKHFGLPVSIEYDGHTAVLGEWWMGAGKGRRSVVSVIIGTGVGGGMVLDGHLIRGMDRLAGAVGWFSFGHEDAAVAVESRSLGNWEALIAGPGIARRVRQVLSECSLLEKQKSKLTTDSTAKEVFTFSRQGDVLALQIVDELAELIGLGLANIVSMVNPEIIILGGSVGANAAFLIPQIKETVIRYAQPVSAKSVQIVSSKLGTKAGLLGAAYGALLRKNLPDL